jgi:hypothetical protein
LAARISAGQVSSYDVPLACPAEPVLQALEKEEHPGTLVGPCGDNSPLVSAPQRAFVPVNCAPIPQTLIASVSATRKLVPLLCQGDS